MHEIYLLSGQKNKTYIAQEKKKGYSLINLLS